MGEARWTNAIGQCSVISDRIHYHDQSEWPFNLLVGFLLANKRDPVKVSDAVKKAIARSLIQTSGKLTRGETSLRQNGVLDHYSWTMKDRSQVEIMLIWHIATDYCDLAPSVDQRDEIINPNAPFDDQRDEIIGPKDYREVAVSLSRYYMYLAAFVPELLPYDAVDIRELRSRVAVRAPKVLRTSPPSRRYEELKGSQSTEEQDRPSTVFYKGVKLGKQLERMSEAQRWKVMADFWAEAIVYVAPSHNTAEHHLRRLEDSGEFLTHLWALLSHAGILNLDRDKDQQAGPAAEVV